MKARWPIAVLVLAVVGLTVAPVASGAVVSTLGDDADDESESNTTVGTVMQSNSAATESAVASGMFDAKYETADEERQGELVVDRTDDLEATLAELEAEREELADAKDDLSTGQYQARMAKLAVELSAVDRAIEDTKPRAAERGVAEDRLDDLRENASTLSGPEVAEMARGLAGHDHVPGQGPPADGDTGPPGDDENALPADREANGSSDDGSPPGQAGDVPGDTNTTDDGDEQLTADGTETDNGDDEGEEADGDDEESDEGEETEDDEESDEGEETEDDTDGSD